MTVCFNEAGPRKAGSPHELGHLSMQWPKGFNEAGPRKAGSPTWRYCTAPYRPCASMRPARARPEVPANPSTLYRLYSFASMRPARARPEVRKLYHPLFRGPQMLQ